jgi:hypothetical protein
MGEEQRACFIQKLKARCKISKRLAAQEANEEIRLGSLYGTRDNERTSRSETSRAAERHSD